MFGIENVVLQEKTQRRRILLKARRDGFEGELMVHLRNEREEKDT